MPGYVKKALHKFNHKPPNKPQHSPHQWTRPTYGTKVQHATDNDSPPASATAATYAQQVTGTFLYYALAINNTMLVSLNTISTQQFAPTEATMSEITWLLDYAATHPEAVIRYSKSDMILWIKSDASYLSAPNARSCAGGHFYLSNKPTATETDDISNTPKPNGAIYVLAKTMNSAMSSAMEAKVGAAFIN